MGIQITMKEDNSREVLSEKDLAVLRALSVIGLLAERYSKLICPVDTGRLRNSISNAVKGDSAYIGTNVEYAKYVELGTSRQKAQPYLRPAVTNHVEEYKQVIETVMRGR